MDGPAPAHLTPITLRPLMAQFLTWIALRERPYEQVMEAWRSNCPRDPVWEDALAAGLIRLAPHPGQRMAEAPVVLTQAGQDALDRA